MIQPERAGLAGEESEPQAIAAHGAGEEQRGLAQFELRCFFILEGGIEPGPEAHEGGEPFDRRVAQLELCQRRVLPRRIPVPGEDTRLLAQRHAESEAAAELQLCGRSCWQ